MWTQNSIISASVLRRYEKKQFLNVMHVWLVETHYYWIWLALFAMFNICEKEHLCCAYRPCDCCCLSLASSEKSDSIMYEDENTLIDIISVRQTCFGCGCVHVCYFHQFCPKKLLYICFVNMNQRFSSKLKWVYHAKCFALDRGTGHYNDWNKMNI